LGYYIGKVKEKEVMVSFTLLGVLVLKGMIGRQPEDRGSHECWQGLTFLPQFTTMIYTFIYFLTLAWGFNYYTLFGLMSST
jgi:hypothetical protein